MGTGAPTTVEFLPQYYPWTTPQLETETKTWFSLISRSRLVPHVAGDFPAIEIGKMHASCYCFVCRVCHMLKYLSVILLRDFLQCGPPYCVSCYVQGQFDVPCWEFLGPSIHNHWSHVLVIVGLTAIVYRHFDVFLVLYFQGMIFSELLEQPVGSLSLWWTFQIGVEGGW